MNGLAVDWVSKHIYWTDEKKRTVEVADYDGNNRRLLHYQDLLSPRGIFVDPITGWVIWIFIRYYVGLKSGNINCTVNMVNGKYAFRLKMTSLIHHVHVIHIKYEREPALKNRTALTLCPRQVLHVLCTRKSVYKGHHSHQQNVLGPPVVPLLVATTNRGHPLQYGHDSLYYTGCTLMVWHH